ncbi:hypothetical protein [Streptomyces tibetensis]|uniref:hypothetical protein n=1 Tax=Streptomyces tibetensis TaxID=2382123 RepID=UPI0033EBAAC8
MEYTAASLVSRVADDLGPMADEVIADVVRCLRREVPELWSNPDLVRMTSENIAAHVVGVLVGLEHGIEPSEIDPPAAELERARRLARHGAPVTALLRAFRLGQGVLLDRLLAEMPRLTKDAELVSAASRLLIAMANRSGPSWTGRSTPVPRASTSSFSRRRVGGLEDEQARRHDGRRTAGRSPVPRGRLRPRRAREHQQF